MKKKNNTPQHYAIPLLRIGLSLVFLWFGIKQLLTPSWGIALLPSWTHYLGITETAFVIANGLFEVVLGILLILGLFTRCAAILLTLHLVGILLTLGYNEIAVRDFGLMMGTLAVALHGTDRLCLENTWRMAP